MMSRGRALTWLLAVVVSLFLTATGVLAPTAAQADDPVAAPTNLNAVAGDSSVAVSWDDGNLAQPAESYDVYSSFIADSGYELTGSCAGVSAGIWQTCTVSGLTNGFTYYFAVVATIGGVDSGMSAAVSATPAGLPDAPISVNATGGSGAATISWVEPSETGGVMLTRYYVYSASSTTPDTDHASPAGGDCGGVLGVDPMTTACTVSLAVGGYVFFVTAYNGVGEFAGPYSIASPPVTVSSPTPGPPTGVAASSPSAGHATVTWTAPSATGSSALSGFVVQVATSPSGDYAQANDSCALDQLTGSSTSCTMSGLTNGTAYRVRVAAKNSGFTSAYATGGSTVTPSGPPAVPGSVSAYPSRGSAVLTWTAPATNGSAITSYHVQVAESPSGTWGDPTGTCSMPVVSALSCTASNLTNGVAYMFKVLAHNLAGDGAYSDSTSAVTPAADALPSQVASRCPNGSCANADLIGLNLSGLNLAGIDFTGANLTGTNLTGANLVGANLHSATLTAATLTGINLAGADLSGSSLIAVVGTGGNYHGANFSKASLVAAKLGNSDLVGANFSGAHMVGTSRSFARALRSNGPTTFANANLSKANFTNAKANKVIFTGANLTQAKFIGAKLVGANLSKVKAGKARFTRADLTGANLTSADIRGADFHSAKVKKIKLAHAKYKKSTFAGARR